jgi:hypothetical protein
MLSIVFKIITIKEKQQDIVFSKALYLTKDLSLCLAAVSYTIYGGFLDGITKV